MERHVRRPERRRPAGPTKAAVPAHTEALFDRNGNIGPTLWWRGRIIGAWAQHPKGHLDHRLLTDPGAPARAAVRAEIVRLDAFLDGTRVTPCYRTPLELRLAA
ncbi:DNA glycosylase AlkZ-like family protein [Streptomyces lunalinharesii]|uniref:Winged helix DNA-binding domain-containing protein n=1 Tax=Streptomyces lunalinharesii TaxID=333384 RepID=A0ABP6F772_9ACTN